jgi:hypothetical protein
MSQRGRSYLMVVMVIVLLTASSMAGCLGGDDNGDNGNGNGGGEVLANAGTDVFGLVGEPVSLNGSTSSGEIVKYWWDVESTNASDPLTEDLVGEVVQYTYNEPGVYLITLTVEGKKNKVSNDTVTAFIDLVEDRSGTLEINEVNETFEYTVTEDVQSVLLTLTYSTMTDGIVPLPILLDMDVMAGETQPIATSTTQPPDQGDTQTEELDVPTGTIISNGGFTVVIRWGGTLVPEAPFVLSVEIHYRAV